MLADRLPLDVGAVLLSTMASYVLDFGPGLLWCLCTDGALEGSGTLGESGPNERHDGGPSASVVRDHVAGDMVAKVEAYAMLQEAAADHTGADAARRASPQVAEAGRAASDL